MSKKSISISLISLATFFLLLFSTVPHHHHEGGAIHFLTTCCAHADTDNDEQENHEQSGKKSQTSNNHQGCVAESEFIASNSDSEKKCSAGSCDLSGDDHFHFFPLYFLTADFLSSGPDYAAIKPEYGEYLLFDTSSHINQINGLRAPPFCLS